MQERSDSGLRFLLEENRSLAAGTILASALAAAVIAYLLRRRRIEEEYGPAPITERALEAAREAVGPERLEAVGEFFAERVLPELKPALLGMLKDLQQVVDSYFRRAERAIKAM